MATATAPKLPRWLLLPAIAFAGWAGLRALRGGSGTGGHPWPVPADRGVPFAVGGRPVWPIAASSSAPRKHEVPYRDVDGVWHGNVSRAFKAERGGRYHAGIDLYANSGDVLVSPESGVIVGRQTFLNGTGAMLIQLDSGVTVLLGETMMGGAEEVARRFGTQPVGIGTRVRAGQPVTVVGTTDAGSHMLHIETYACCPKHNDPWYAGNRPPPLLRDPTNWLLKAPGAFPGA